MKLYIFKNMKNLPEYAIGNMTEVQENTVRDLYTKWTNYNFNSFINHIRSHHRIYLTPVSVGNIFRKYE